MAQWEDGKVHDIIGRQEGSWHDGMVHTMMCNL